MLPGQEGWNMKTRVRTYFERGEWKNSLLMAAKLSAGCILAIAAAYELDVRYSATAGVITVLSIQKYKLETIRTALKRLMAFGVALFVAWAAFSMFGFTTLGYGAFLFVFVFLCVTLEWEIALSICVVLVSHLLEQGEMTRDVLVNEFLVFGIGTGVGILMNLHLRRDVQTLKRRVADVDHEFCRILLQMADSLRTDGPATMKMDAFERFEENLYYAEQIAWANRQNSIWKKDDRYMRYIMIRREQCEILYDMKKRIGQLDVTPVQAEHIRVFLEHMAWCCANGGDDILLVEELDGLFEEMRTQKLPVLREEFENRAVLFVFMLHLRELIELHERSQRTE